MEFAGLHILISRAWLNTKSAKHKKRRDKRVAKCSGSSGSIVKAFNYQDAHIGVCNNIVIVVLTMYDLTSRDFFKTAREAQLPL